MYLYVGRGGPPIDYSTGFTSSDAPGTTRTISTFNTVRTWGWIVESAQKSGAARRGGVRRHSPARLSQQLFSLGRAPIVSDRSAACLTSERLVRPVVTCVYSVRCGWARVRAHVPGRASAAGDVILNRLQVRIENVEKLPSSPSTHLNLAYSSI